MATHRVNTWEYKSLVVERFTAVATAENRRRRANLNAPSTLKDAVEAAVEPPQPESVSEILTSLGVKGWELVNIIPVKGEHWASFKRRLAIQFEVE